MTINSTATFTATGETFYFKKSFTLKYQLNCSLSTFVLPTNPTSSDASQTITSDSTIRTNVKAYNTALNTAFYSYSSYITAHKSFMFKDSQSVVANSNDGYSYCLQRSYSLVADPAYSSTQPLVKSQR